MSTWQTNQVHNQTPDLRQLWFTAGTWGVSQLHPGLAVLIESSCPLPTQYEYESTPVPRAKCFTKHSASPWQQPSICFHVGVVRLRTAAFFFFPVICLTSYKFETLITGKGHLPHRRKSCHIAVQKAKRKREIQNDAINFALSAPLRNVSDVTSVTDAAGRGWKW